MTQALMDCYRAIEASSERMLQAAQNANWDEVVRHEGVCAVLIERLRMQSETERLRTEDRPEKFRIMQRILRNDAQIRNLAEPWLTQLDAWQAPAVVLH